MTVELGTNSSDSDADLVLDTRISSGSEYESAYFDTSDESLGEDQIENDDDASSLTPKSKRRVLEKTNKKKLTHEELLYDPQLDEQNEAWITGKMRRIGISRRSKPATSSGVSAEESVGCDLEQSGGDIPGLSYLESRHVSRQSQRHTSEEIEVESDAVLSCPMCMAILTYDCQQHVEFHNQYRAMFVESCKVVRSEVYRYTDSGLVAVQNVGALNDDTFYPVKCEECDTQVAVFDRDEVYHFFHVLVSPPLS